MRVISLFCGCGGLDLGFLGGFTYLGKRFAKTGAVIVRAVDSDPGACSLYRLNVGEVVCADVREIGEWPEADLVIGGPPCQPYSAAGNQRGILDPRDMLAAFVRVVKVVRPRAFLIENVPALAERDAFAEAFARLLRLLAEAGYSLAHRVLDAADYGAPQHRRRLFVTGFVDDDANGFDFPRPSFGPGSAKPYLRVRDALADLHLPVHAAGLRRLAEGERRHPAFGASSRRLTADKPFPTVKAADTAKNRLIHPWFDRYLTMPELLRAQTFPDDFIAPKKTPAIGNAVPPVLAWHLAQAFRKALIPRPCPKP